MRSRICVISMLLTFLFITYAVAHVPITGGENNSLETAIEVQEPTKSWAIYDEIHEIGEAKYYKFHMENGQRLKISLFTPDKGFSPGIVVMGEGLTTNDMLPRQVEAPEGYNYLVFHAEQTEDKEYEPFTPTSYYFTAEVDIEVNTTGTYYIAVYDETDHGKVGIAIGYVETFSITEWLLIPIDAINIHLWEGQNIAVILVPIYLVIIIGFLLLFWKIKKEQKLELNINASIAIIAALLYIGSGLVIIMQMIMALLVSKADSSIIITLLFGLLPILFGILLFRESMKITKDINNKNRALIIVYGILGLVLWSGIIIGPILAIITSILPTNITRNK